MSGVKTFPILDALEALDLQRTKGVRAFFEQSPFLLKEALMKGAEVNFLLRLIILFFFVAKFSEKMEKYLLVVEGSGADEIWSFALFRVAPQRLQIHLQPASCSCGLSSYSFEAARGSDYA